MPHRHVQALMRCLIVLTLVAPARAENKAEAWREKALDLATPVVTAELTPGMVIGIYREGDIAFVGVGQLSPGDESTPTADTVYEIGSISKTFTGVLLADAVVRGEVTLDAPLSSFMPEGLKAPAHEAGPITLEALATHRSALPRMPLNLGAVDPANPYAAYTEDQLWAMIDGFRLTRPPGETYVYSNLAVGLLGTILADKADMTYAELLRTRICEPLDMTDTSIVLTDAQRARLAPPHLSGGVPSTNWDFDCLAPCGGIRSTARDMMRFLAAHLDRDAAG
jgi:D-alanyl-D-alanine-carboxypeptidase/D-alanyl-D-alanine-endopeptidase